MLLFVIVTITAPSTVMGRELAPLTCVTKGKMVSSLMNMSWSIDRGRTVSSAPKSGTALCVVKIEGGAHDAFSGVEVLIEHRLTCLI